MGTEEIGVAQSQSINHHLQLYQPPPPHMNAEFRNSGSSFSDDEGSEDEEDEVEGIADLDSKDGSKLGWKEGNVVVAGSGSDLRNAVTIVESGGGSYDAQSSRGGEKGVGFSGRKEGSHVSESMESLRTILSDPVTGRLMDDAMILRCGHSFGSGGLEHVLRMVILVIILIHLVSKNNLNLHASVNSEIMGSFGKNAIHVCMTSLKTPLLLISYFEQLYKHFVEKKSYMPAVHQKGGEKDMIRKRDVMVTQHRRRTPGEEVFNFLLI